MQNIQNFKILEIYVCIVLMCHYEETCSFLCFFHLKRLELLRLLLNDSYCLSLFSPHYSEWILAVWPCQCMAYLPSYLYIQPAGWLVAKLKPWQWFLPTNLSFSLSLGPAWQADSLTAKRKKGNPLIKRLYFLLKKDLCRGSELLLCINACHLSAIPERDARLS